MIENQNNLINPSKDQNSGKLVSSYFTSTSSQLFNKKRLSLGSCSSSVSIYEKDHQSSINSERKLVIRLLHAKSQIHLNKILLEIKSKYKNEMLQLIEGGRTMDKNKIPLQFEYFPQIYEIVDRKTLNYLFNLYLQHMDYKGQKNKRYILGRAKLKLKLEDLPKVVQFYETFGEKILDKEKRFKLLESTCLNGWEYFIQEMCHCISDNKNEKIYIFNS